MQTALCRHAMLRLSHRRQLIKALPVLPEALGQSDGHHGLGLLAAVCAGKAVYLHPAIAARASVLDDALFAVLFTALLAAAAVFFNACCSS